MKAPKEFKELPSGNSYIIEMQNKSNQSLGQTIDMAKKDAWNAAVIWAANNANCTYNDYDDFINGKETYIVDKQSILNGLIED